MSKRNPEDLINIDRFALVYVFVLMVVLILEYTGVISIFGLNTWRLEQKEQSSFQEFKDLEQRLADYEDLIKEKSLLKDRYLNGLPDKVYVFFDVNIYDIKAGYKKVLDNLIFQLGLTPEYELSILGYADNVGTESDNERLSEKRAKKVKNYILDRDSKIRIKEADGLGESQRELNPDEIRLMNGIQIEVDGNSKIDAQSKNRRVTINLNKHSDLAVVVNQLKKELIELKEVVEEVTIEKGNQSEEIKLLKEEIKESAKKDFWDYLGLIAAIIAIAGLFSKKVRKKIGESIRRLRNK